MPRTFWEDNTALSDAVGELLLVGCVVIMAVILMANVTPLITHHSTKCQIQISAHNNSVTILVAAGHVDARTAVILIQYSNGTPFAILHYYRGKFVGRTDTGTAITSANTVPSIMYPCDYILLTLPAGHYRFTIATRQSVITQIPVYVP